MSSGFLVKEPLKLSRIFLGKSWSGSFIVLTETPKQHEQMTSLEKWVKYLRDLNLMIFGNELTLRV